MHLTHLLQQSFGFPGFRANQEAVCRAATDGRDVLLVMPTGAGKSLCYQLPAIARGGTALVVSPLIALMDDQANKLSAAGFAVARIHSGLSREQSRQSCRDYLDGKLQFLFIAPERLRVPGFPEMLARRKPSLVAIDEAHCISAWGHDFRPDYRTLGEHLPALRPAPVVALTATATPTVQRDIVTQLRLEQPALFIHGFRRENLHIEVVELSKPQRPEFIATFLSTKERRPAIVYAPSRKVADELAGQLGRRFPTAAYHAGLEPAVRDRVQREFLAGRLEVVVATIAFGMGIDKADVRTVLHAALPASVEAYYQEIGRAGRDGNASRTVLLYSYADRKMHDFFLDRDYPPVTDLQKTLRALTEEFQMPDVLAPALKMSRDVLGRSLEKLAAQGEVQMDMAGNVRRTERRTSRSGPADWQAGYGQQITFRRSQIDRMLEFAEGQSCRMLALVRHFGDTADGVKPCGHCDVCQPGGTEAQSFAAPSPAQERDLRAILRALDGAMPRSTGRLFTDLALGGDRKQFDALLQALARAGLVGFESDTFTNAEGKAISYKKVSLTYEGQTLAPGAPLEVVLPAVAESGGPRRSSAGSGKTTKKAAREQRTREIAAYTPEQETLSKALKAWRTEEARPNGRPAFLVLTDAVLQHIVLARPTTLGQLAEVHGIGQAKVDTYGAQICALCRGEYPATLFGDTEPAKPHRAPKSQTRSHGRGHAAPQETSIFSSEPAAAEPVALPPEPARPRAVAPSPESFTAEQQSLEVRLREWRKTESEKLGLPQFFVLGTTALRTIVVERPQTLRELGTIQGIGPDKLHRFGASIVALCSA